MQRRNGFPFVFLVSTVFLFPVLTPTLLQSQTIWTNVGRNKSFTVEYLRPNLEGDNDLSGLSSALFLSGQFRINRLTNLILELPLARLEESGSAFEIDQTMVGNPYIGLEIRSRSSSNFVELGIRPPIASESKVLAAAVGIATDSDRLEAFVPNLISLSGKINQYNKGDSGGISWFRAGPTIWIPTEGGDSEIFIDYAGLYGFEGIRLVISLGVTGRFLVTADEGNFGERSFHQLGGTASLRFGNLLPGVHYRIPLDEDSKRIIDHVFGFNLNILLN